MTRRRLTATVLTVAIIAGLATTRVLDDDPAADQSGQRRMEPTVGGTRDTAAAR